jgi:hypothetical protein
MNSGHKRLVNHTLWIPKKIFKTKMHVMCESRKICSRIGLKKQENWITLLRMYSMSTQNNDSQSTSLPPLIRSFLLKYPHSPVMYITIYPFAIALLNHTIHYQLQLASFQEHLKALQKKKKMKELIPTYLVVFVGLMWICHDF